MKIKTQEIKKKVLKNLKEKERKNRDKSEDLLVNNPVIEQAADEDFDDNESLTSEQELQLAFARKELTPGLNIELPAPKEYKNDRDALERKLKSLYLNLDWIERMDLTISKSEIEKLEQRLENLESTNENGQKELVNNDFKRESLFMKQAELAIMNALPKLEQLNVKRKRPEDYFAQMAKSDEHMRKVKESLLSKHAEMERREKIRKLRELKKMGKQIQIEAQKKKEQAKKKLNEKVKKYQKSDKKDDISILLEEDDEQSKKRRKLNGAEENGESKKRSEKQEPMCSDGKKIASKRTQYKDKKYGFGGRKKRSKSNTAESYAEGFVKTSNKKKGGKFAHGNSKATMKKFTNKNKPKNKKK